MSNEAAFVPTAVAKPLAPQGNRNFGPILLYALIALGMLWPYWPAGFHGAGDLSSVLGGIVEARNALLEGQFPIRVAPELNNGLRYPLFQYYGNFPYTAAGALCAVLNFNPYSAWKIVSFMIFVCAGFYTFRLTYQLTRNHPASSIAGVIFLCSPYLFTDLNARGAYAEMVAFSMLPAAFYFTLKCLASTRWRYNALCAVSWALIALSHNITYLYAVTFAVPFFLPYVLTKRFIGRIVRMALVIVLHVLLILWYILPQMQTVNVLWGGVHGLFDPFEWAPLTTLHILFAPMLTNSALGQTTSGLGLQIGWPILGGAILAFVRLFFRFRRSGKWRGITIRLILLTFLAFFLAWSPMDFWKYLPKVYWYIQFPYRALMFVVLFGSTLTARGLAMWLPRRFPTVLLVLILGLTGLAISSYIPREYGLDTHIIASQMSKPTMGSGVIYQYLPASESLVPTNLSDASPDNMNWPERLLQIRSAVGNTSNPSIAPLQHEIQAGGLFTCHSIASTPKLLELPVLYYPRILEVQDNGNDIPYGNSGHFVAVHLQPGAHQIDVCFVGVHWANILGYISWGGLAIGIAFISVRRGAISFHFLGNLSAQSFSNQLSAGTAICAFLALACIALIARKHPIQWWLDRSSRMSLSASSVLNSSSGPEMAFDSDEGTAWVAANSHPAVLTATLLDAAVLQKIELQAKVTRLYEAWQHVRVVLILNGKTVYSQECDFPSAAHEPLEAIAIPSVKTDKVELYFSNAVTEKRDGSRVSPETVWPGYTEIRFNWAK
jgi:hypothetical protein